ncbi:hypothetical protein M513_05064 [Trichuris suis]|uniref:GTPase-activating protein pac-1 n=1 Tax=Trichuris suis TaxID=68888 RepID=A0A085M9Z9_9BILA|nr:hypothetical protein M513_05064 [Trichuris suis]
MNGTARRSYKVFYAKTSLLQFSTSVAHLFKVKRRNCHARFNANICNLLPLPDDSLPLIITKPNRIVKCVDVGERSALEESCDKNRFAGWGAAELLLTFKSPCRLGEKKRSRGAAKAGSSIGIRPSNSTDELAVKTSAWFGHFKLKIRTFVNMKPSKSYRKDQTNSISHKGDIFEKVDRTQSLEKSLAHGSFEADDAPFSISRHHCETVSVLPLDAKGQPCSGSSRPVYCWPAEEAIGSAFARCLLAQLPKKEMNGAFVKGRQATSPSFAPLQNRHYLTPIEERPENVGPPSDGNNVSVDSGTRTATTPRAAPRFLRRGLVKTGAVSQIVQAMRDSQEQDSRYSAASSSSTVESTTAPTVDSKDNKPDVSAEQVRLVRTLICIFESGAVDRVGPLKLYHAQTYKRELSRISAHNLGQVLRKTKRFNQLLNTPRRHSLDSQAMLESLNAAPGTHPSCRYLGDGDVSEADKGRALSSVLDDALEMYDGSLSPTSSMNKTSGRFRRQKSFLRAVTGSAHAYGKLENSNDHPSFSFTPLRFTRFVHSSWRSTWLLANQYSLFRFVDSGIWGLSGGRSIGKGRQCFSGQPHDVGNALSGPGASWDLFVNNEQHPQVATPVVHVTRPASMLYSNGDQPTDPAVVLPMSVSQTNLQQPKPVAVVSRRPVHSDVMLPKVRFANGDGQRSPLTMTLSLCNRLKLSSLLQREQIFSMFPSLTFFVLLLLLFDLLITLQETVRKYAPAPSRWLMWKTRRSAPDGRGPFPIETAEERDQLLAGPRFVRRRNGRREKRITRFINLYNSSQGRLGEAQDDSCSLSPSCSSSLSDSSIPKAAGPQPSAPLSVGATAPTQSDTIYREGILYHKQPSNSGRSSHDRSWQLYWAFLIDHTLHLCPEKSMLAVSPTSVAAQKFVHFIREKATLSIDVRSCIADIAYNQVKRKSVFRCITVKQSEHLFQAVDDKDMIGWIEALQSCAKGAEQETVSPSSLALIIKRYERQSHCSSSSVSPSVKLKKSVQSPSVKGGAPKAMAEEGAPEQAPPPPPPAPPATSSSSSQQQPHHSEATLKRVRKWCKTRFPAAANTATVATSQAPRDDQSRPCSAVFGLHLEDCLTTGETDYVPLIIQLCVKVVEAYGLDTVGVYRIPGNTAAVNTLSASLDQGFEFVEFDDIRWRDVNVVSSLLKAFFRKLPDPLLTSNLYRHFIEANRIESPELRLKTLRDLVRKLPRHNYETLRYLMHHLNRVVAHSAINKMEAKNLALMFGPSLVRPSGENMVAMVTHMSDQCKIVESLIVYCDWIFGEDTTAEPVDPSSAEVGQLLDFIGNSERDLKKAKENIVKNLVNVRAVKNEYASAPQTTALSGSPCDERNIDEEIARAYRLDILNDAPAGGGTIYDEQTSRLVLPESTRELIEAAEDYKRSREEQIYTARRIFIAGGTPTESVDNKINLLAQHCRHLNINNADSLDVLSPETREKIKQFQRGHPLWTSGRAPLNFPQSPSTMVTSQQVDADLLESEGRRSSLSRSRPLGMSSSCDSLDEAHFAGGGGHPSPTSKSYDFAGSQLSEAVATKEAMNDDDDEDNGKQQQQQQSLLSRGRLRHVKPEFSFFRRMVANDCPPTGQSEGGESRHEGASKEGRHRQHRQYNIGNLLKFSRKAAALPQERRRDLRRHTLGSMETEQFRSGRRQFRHKVFNDEEGDHDDGGRGDEPVQLWLKESPLRRSNPDMSSPSMPSMGDRPLWVHS